MPSTPFTANSQQLTVKTVLSRTIFKFFSQTWEHSLHL
ncbi:hypothetical protein CKA32_001315 [Geitlerinema sp. FC II]|nr:hypothetical protein CKA32_001315 [Geitlerinema sp. FC II]